MNVDRNPPRTPLRFTSEPRPSRTQQWTALLLSISLTAMAAAIIWVGFLQGIHPPPGRGSVAVAADAVATIAETAPSAAEYPVELLVMARAVSTALAPTAAPPSPTATYAMSTEPPTVVCGPWVELGTVCSMPKAAAPTPTPLPDCPVMPLAECIWRGSLSMTPRNID